MKKYTRFKMPTRPLKNMINFKKELRQHSDIFFMVEVSEEEKKKAESCGFLYVSPSRLEKNTKYVNETIKLLSKTKEMLKFTYETNADIFYFDIVSEYKNINKSSKRIIKKIFELNGVDTALLSLARENDFIANISPIKFSHALISDSKELENLGLRRIKGDYFRGVAFVTESEFNEYKRKLLPAYLSWLETGKFPSKSIKVKMTKNLNILSFCDNPKYKKRTGVIESFYYNDNESFLFDEDTGYCKRKIERLPETNIFKVKLFYKSGEEKIVSYHKALEGQDKRFLEGILNSSSIYAKNGIGLKLYSQKGELIINNYYGISRVINGKAHYTDYTKSFNVFFKKIEKELNSKLSNEDKERLVKILHSQLSINIVNIEKTMKDSHNIKINEFSSIIDFIDFMELFFSV